eukprot:Rmarinus@m.11059
MPSTLVDFSKWPPELPEPDTKYLQSLNMSADEYQKHMAAIHRITGMAASQSARLWLVASQYKKHFCENPIQQPPEIVNKDGRGCFFVSFGDLEKASSFKELTWDYAPLTMIQTGYTPGILCIKEYDPENAFVLFVSIGTGSGNALMDACVIPKTAQKYLKVASAGS